MYGVNFVAVVALGIFYAGNTRGINMKLCYEGLKDRDLWASADVKLPEFDWKAMCLETEKSPVWVHFGAGNIFRGFIARLQQELLNKGLAKSGIVAADTLLRNN